MSLDDFNFGLDFLAPLAKQSPTIYIVHDGNARDDEPANKNTQLKPEMTVMGVTAHRFRKWQRQILSGNVDEVKHDFNWGDAKQVTAEATSAEAAAGAPTKTHRNDKNTMTIKGFPRLLAEWVITERADRGEAEVSDFLSFAEYHQRPHHYDGCECPMQLWLPAGECATIIQKILEDA